MGANYVSSLFRNRKSSIVLIAVTLSCMLCCGYVIKFPYCVDPLSGHVPAAAIERFIQQVVEKTLTEDYDGLVSMSNETAARKLLELKPKMSANYKIINRDNLGSSYECTIEFDNGTYLYLALQGAWFPCPDYNIAEEKIFKNIKLMYVAEPFSPTPTPGLSGK
jgi:hypothetical protein